MDTSGMISILQNFGALGIAFGVAGSVGWTIWIKIIKPQQEEIRKEHKAHIETLQKLAEDNRQITRGFIEEFMDSSKENIAALKELNGRIATHHAQMHAEHQQGISAIKDVRRQK